MNPENDYNDYINKNAFSWGPLNDEQPDKDYWLAQSPEKRWAAIEFNRRIIFGYGDTPPRFQRIFEITRF